MTTLIHLNGPPAIGKSTLSALYADRHPGTLNLDIDSLHPLVGGWQDGDGRTHDVLRPVALAMASAHLAGGRDVILPQYLATIEEIAAFEAVARTHGARFREVVLLTGRDEALLRFENRPDHSEWEQYNRRLVARLGGPELLVALYDRLQEILRLRPDAAVVQSRTDAVEETYTALLEALQPSAGQ